MKHVSAEPSHYNAEAEFYDKFNEKNSETINRTLELILKKHKVKSVVDLTCGTGSQVFWLTNNGFYVEGYDINAKMLKLASAKEKKSKHSIKFKKGDIRTTKAGTFDAAISIFNAVGHLTVSDFKKAIKNIHSNLKKNGLFVFDNFNLDYLLYKDNITKLTIDILKKADNKTAREIQYSTIDDKGVLASFDTYIRQTGKQKPKVGYASQTLQVYSANQLKDMLLQCGFKVVKQCNIDGSRFSKTKSERILTVAKKQ